MDPMEQLQALLESSEFAAVKAAADALPAELLLEPTVRPHLEAFRIGMTALANIEFAEPEDEGEG